MSILVLGSIRFQANDIPAVIVPLRRLVKEARASDGCYCFDVAEDLLDSGVVRFSEVWRDQFAADRHFDSAHLAAWRAAIEQYKPDARAFISYEVNAPERV